MTVVTSTDRPKSVRNRCIIGVFDGIFVLSIGFRMFVGIGFFFIGLSKISFSFLLVTFDKVLLDERVCEI